ncbi:MAG: DUF2177 family protein [Gammaproteobacteria bacterium]|nr:DUF2177 family protein [Gammaproteobacteria bacterium]
MFKYVVVYSVILIVMFLLDFIWLGYIAKSFYQNSMGHLMAARPNFFVAFLFYAIFSVGLLIFAVAPHGAINSWSTTFVTAALFGFFAYATYDLTNLATLKNWPISLTVVDIAWGTFVSGISAVAGRSAWEWFATAIR